MKLWNTARGDDMTIAEGIKKTLLSATAGAAIAAMLLGSAAAVPAQTKEDSSAHSYCRTFSRGNQEEFERCMDRQYKAKERLKDLSIKPQEDTYCKRFARGSVEEYEKCINKLRTPKKSKKTRK